MTEPYLFSVSWGRISAERTERPAAEQLGGPLEPAIAEHPYWRVKGQSAAMWGGGANQQLPQENTDTCFEQIARYRDRLLKDHEEEANGVNLLSQLLSTFCRLPSKVRLWSVSVG